MKRISLTVPDTMYEALQDFASQYHMPMALYTRMLLCQALHIGPELEEVKRRVDELQAVVHGFAEALMDIDAEDMIEVDMHTHHHYNHDL